MTRLNTTTSSLHNLIAQIKQSARFTAKQAINILPRPIYVQTGQPQPHLSMPGDDTAAFPTENGFTLFAAEGMDSRFLQSQPYVAGWASVMVNASDVAAMGGTASAVAVTLWHNNESQAAKVLHGVNTACEVFDITYSGGHTSLEENHTPALSVSIVGQASSLLSCYNITPNMDIYALLNPIGKWQLDTLYWNCVADRTPPALRDDWALLSILADKSLVVAAKDISNAGLLGTLVMLLELTQSGANIDLGKVGLPNDATLADWLMAFHSFGFILVSETQKRSQLETMFSTSHLQLCHLGSTTQRPQITVHLEKESAVFWDFSKQVYTGASARSN